LDFGR